MSPPEPIRVDTPLGGVFISKLPTARVKDCQLLISHCFDNGEPVSGALTQHTREETHTCEDGEKKDEGSPWMMAKVPSIIETDCSVYLLNEHGEILGGLTANTKHHEQELERQEHEREKENGEKEGEEHGPIYSTEDGKPTIMDLMSLFEELHTVVGNNHPHGKDMDAKEALHVITVGVLPKYRGCGLLNIALEHLVFLARQSGFKYVYAETSSAYSLKAFCNRGGEILHKVEYAVWKNKEGSRPFIGIKAPHELLASVWITL